MQADGLLLTGFGGPDCPDAVGPFMRNLTGREPDPAVVERVRARYERIGGCSPLVATAAELGRLVEQALRERGRAVPVSVGMRYWAPTIAEAVEELAGRGCRCLAHVSLSPLEAGVTHERYREAIEAAVRSHAGLHVCEGPSLSQLKVYPRLHAEALAAALSELGERRVLVAFTAHSLPVEAGRIDDAYVRGFRSVCDAVAVAAGMPAGAGLVLSGHDAWGRLDCGAPWVACYQSRGARGSSWLGPDVDDVIDAARGLGVSGFVVAPVGFALDHMETLYDVDVEIRSAAESAGLAFARSSVPNAHPALAEGIADAVARMGCGEG